MAAVRGRDTAPERAVGVVVRSLGLFGCPLPSFHLSLRLTMTKHSTSSGTLPFNITPEFLEDLGVNLYTSLEKVLVEFLANAYDADAHNVWITLDSGAIDAARKLVRAQWQSEVAQVKSAGNEPVPLDSRTLDETHSIAVQDDGVGMTLDDLREKFLKVSRRKRNEEGATSASGRAFMGRKGLGKLAGFGVAHKIVIVSRTSGQETATSLVLDFESIRSKGLMKDVIVPYEVVPVPAEFPESGTRVELTKLTFSGLAGKQNTILGHLADYFWMVRAEDFSIHHGGNTLLPTAREFAYAYPEDPGKGHEELLDAKTTVGGKPYTFQYRLRFTKPKQQMPASEHGVRIYANHRLAAMPSLFGVKSSSNGFKYAAYLDGVVVADFVDEQPTDYISTNRQGLRWETDLLEDFRNFIQGAIVKALDAYAESQDESVRDLVLADDWTKKQIRASGLPASRDALAWKLAVVLAKGDADGVQATFYKKSLPLMLGGLSRGDILDAIAKMAKENSPNLADVVREVTELTQQEFGDLLAVIQGRLDGIRALEKIVKTQSWDAPEAEDTLQECFEENPWLIDPTFFQFLSADESQGTLNDRLAKHLQIWKHTPKGYNKGDPDEKAKFGTNKRPDLCFLLCNEGLARVIIVELKSPNTPLHIKHWQQLQNYIRRTEDFLQAHKGGHQFKVTGLLIGTRAAGEDFKREDVKQLSFIEKKRADNAEWEVRDIMEVLARSRRAHDHILNAGEALKAKAARASSGAAPTS